MKHNWRTTQHSMRLLLLAMMVLSLANCSNPTLISGQETLILPTDTQSTSTITASPTTGGDTSIYRWTISDIPRGLKAPPSEQFFKSFVDAKRIDTMGAELHVRMNPVTDESCVQQFKVGWEFDHDIETVREGDTISITVFNEGGLAECYKNAKNSMAYGGEVVIELKPSGGSHFLSEDRYKHYHEGSSQYLFVVSDPTGIVYPAEPASPAISSTGAILVKDGVHEIGEMDAPHGNFSIAISAGSVFAYTVTYLYDSITD